MTLLRCKNCGGDISFNGYNWNHIPPFAGGSGALKTAEGKKCRRPEPIDEEGRAKK